VRRSVHRLLLIQLWHLGDVLLATPALRSARRFFPEARIDFLTGPAGTDALSDNPHLDRVITWRPGAAAHLQQLARLRGGRYDAVLDFHSQPRTAQFTWATDAPLRIGVRGRGPRNRAYTDLVPRERGPVYMALQKLRLLGPLGVQPESDVDLSLEIAIGPTQRAWAEALLERTGLSGAPLAAVSPVSRRAYKQWGADRWAAVADALTRRGLRILITHGPGERDQAEAVTRGMQAPGVCADEATSVRQLAALYERCVLWLGNDGGAKHVAVAAGVPTVTVSRWGLGPVWTDMRPGSGHTAIERAPPQGCDHRCKRGCHLGCLTAVSPEDVLAAAGALAELSPR
jgi:heptosyltransferase-3